MPWRGPQHPDDFPSLGWGLLEWLGQLPSPRDPSQPLRFTDEQAMSIVRWYAIDERGRRVYRRGYSRRSKGYGKSPVEAAKSIGELAGPVRFDGWDADGEPVGRPWGTNDDPLPWVQVAAVAEDQTDNTWSVVYYFLTENDGQAADDLRIDAGLTRCFLRDRPGAKLEPVTAAAGTREGQPITYGCLDESHLWTPRNGGVKLAATLRRNVAKMGGTSYETTNSFVRGAGSVAEASFKAVRKGAGGIYCDEIEAPREIDGVEINEEAPDGLIARALRVAYGDSWWADVDRFVSEMRDPDTAWADWCQFFLNWNQDAEAIEETGPIKSIVWKSLADPDSVADPSTARIALDTNQERTWFAVCLASRRTDGRLHVETVGGSSDKQKAVEHAVRAADALSVPVVVSSTSSLDEDVRRAGGTPDVMKQADEAAAVAALIDATRGEDPTLRHLGAKDASLSKSLRMADTKPYGNGGKLWQRRTTTGDISPLTGITMALGRVGVDALTDSVPMFAVSR